MTYPLFSISGFTFIIPTFFTCFSMFGSMSLLVAVLVVVASTVIWVVFGRKKGTLDPVAIECEIPESGQKDTLLLSEDVTEGEVSANEVESELEEAMVCDIEFLPGSSNVSASASQAGSDGSVTDDDEDGLFEIAFQEGEPFSLISEECPKAGEISKPPDVLSDNGVLTDDELDEEDNLIELDISMGSIKLP